MPSREMYSCQCVARQLFVTELIDFRHEALSYPQSRDRYW